MKTGQKNEKTDGTECQKTREKQKCTRKTTKKHEKKPQGTVCQREREREKLNIRH